MQPIKSKLTVIRNHTTYRRASIYKFVYKYTTRHHLKIVKALL